MFTGTEMITPHCTAENALSLEREIQWFNQVLETRIKLYFEQDCTIDDITSIPPPDITHDSSGFAHTVRTYNMNFNERIILMLALLPHICPQALDTFFAVNNNINRGFSEFGGWKGDSHGGFLPTGETAAFILAGNTLSKRFDIMRLFEPDHFFAQQNVIAVEHSTRGEPYLSGALKISTATLNFLTTGVRHKPDYTIHFPAKRISSKLDWSELILPPDVLADIKFITTWYNHSETILNDWGLDKVLKPGYRCLFFGPPGTGKTLTATLIGATVGADVYRIDLSMLVSKYIGETEKNLAAIFDQAQNKNWILLFDEADSLFGRRTTTSNSNDRHANQEISYLLQRVEDFPGVVILATNLKANIDEAFARRFQSLIYFPMPDAEQRLRLWQTILASNCSLNQDVNIEEIAEGYEMSGGSITNVVRFASILALQQKRTEICQSDLIRGIRQEMRKEGKTV